MEITGSYTFNAPPDRVWDLLMNPALLSSCIPGCEGFEPEGEDRYKVTLTVGLAAIALRAEGGATAVDVTGSVQTGGTIARLGQRLVGGVAKMMMDRFFACLQSKLTS